MIYQIPYAFRRTAMNGSDEYFGTCTVMTLRGNPCLVFHRSGQQLPSPEVVEQYLIGLDRDKTAIVVADSPEEAIQQFSQFDHAKAGAVWIDTTYRPILELPDCPELHKNKRKEFICGELDTEAPEDFGDPGVHGMCMFEGYDAPDNCPITRAYDIGPTGYEEQLVASEDIADPGDPAKHYKILRLAAIAA